MLLQTFAFAWPEDAISISVIILLALLTRWLVQVAIRRMVKISTDRAFQHLERLGRPGQLLAQATGLESTRQAERAATMGSVIGSAATFIITTVAVLTILSHVGINLGPVLASAGVGGVALAFGAQSLVKDVISGIFLILEDQYGVGDVVTIGTVSGTVEHVGLRVTSIRDANGMLWYVRNGEITTVGNVSQGWSIATVDLPIHPSEDAGRAIDILEGVAEEFAHDEEYAEQLMEAPEVLGVETITGTAMTLRITAKCAANKQWGVQRELRERAKHALDAAGVRGPAVWGPGTTH
ncbi:mechanosensitive ion channel family protein [Luteococcus sp. Sow4_B9]|uniref:mechanosensitive ion channel family protein n=1 Tax=Luteococcus sp. Sow4_B9 TaxID=3438792 RepID=UPI003F9D5791